MVNQNKEVEKKQQEGIFDEEFDLGSTNDVDPFGVDETEVLNIFEKKANQQDSPTQENETLQNQEGIKTKEPQGGSINPIDQAMNVAIEKDMSNAKQSLFEKSPVFEYAGAIEDIRDTSLTFEELRIQKAIDFPELEDGKRVSWIVEYNKTTKVISDPKGTPIEKIKKEIETSKDFLDALKKAKDKNLICKVKPRITAQSKGQVSSYRGVFTNLEDAISSDKSICIMPSRDGNVYEMRRNEIGTFITKAQNCEMLSEVDAGFYPALPLVKTEMLLQIISFFRYFMKDGDSEVLINLYWDKQNKQYVMKPPNQLVTKNSVHAALGSDFTEERYIHYMDIHSHNRMKAFFSSIDDEDEKATRVYTVIGKLDNLFPDIKVRISNGGKFLSIAPTKVFSLNDVPFEREWLKNVVIKEFSDGHGVDTMHIAKEVMGGVTA